MYIVRADQTDESNDVGAGPREIIKRFLVLSYPAIAHWQEHVFKDTSAQGLDLGKVFVGPKFHQALFREDALFLVQHGVSQTKVFSQLIDLCEFLAKRMGGELVDSGA